MQHETISCNLLVNVAEIQQGQRSTDTVPKSGDDFKGCISNIHNEVPSFLPKNTFTFLIWLVQVHQYFVKNTPICSCAAGKGETLPPACSPCTKLQQPFHHRNPLESLEMRKSLRAVCSLLLFCMNQACLRSFLSSVYTLTSTKPQQLCYLSVEMF